MLWNNSGVRLWRTTVFCGALLLMIFASRSWLASAEDKKLSVYAPHTYYSVQVVDRENREYVAIFDLLEPLGKANLKINGAVYKLRVNDVGAEFRADSAIVSFDRARIIMPAKTIIEGGRPLVPLHSAALILSKYLKVQADLHEVGRRLFLDNAASHLVVEIMSSSPGGLVLSFPAPANPTISADGPKIRMVFSKEPVVSGADRISYNDNLISSIAFKEINGSAEITVTGTAPLLANFRDGGKSIVLVPAPGNAGTPQPPAAAVAAQSQASPASTSSAVSATPDTGASTEPAPKTPEENPLLAAVLAPARFFVLIDAGHGGSDNGARLSDDLAEKDVTLAVARRVRAELQNRGINASLLRDGDITMDLNQRAMSANAQRAAIYISIHAGGPGTGVRVFTAFLPDAGATSPQPQKSSAFLPWQSAQAGFLQQSRILANSIVSELGGKNVNSFYMSAPVAPLNHIAAPALAVELAPPFSGSTPSALTNPDYQQTVAAAIAAAVVNARPRMEASR